MHATANAAPAAVEQLAVDTIRTLSMDAVQAANSGHPGTPMALAPLAHRIYTRHLRFDPDAPEWAGRDRFVLSCGHASMLLYSVLHLAGYELSLDELKGFRQLHSPTAGHPELGEVPGVEYTTGPLGQGVAAAAGMALAAGHLAARFDGAAGAPLFGEQRTFVLASDGDLMEGVSGESASLAGHLRLGGLVVFWDDNRITIDGETDLTFSEDVGARYESYGWQVLRLDDVDDLDAIDRVVEEALADGRPTLVVTRTHIGIGSPLQDTSAAHGAPLGDENIRITKERYGWEHEAFHVPDEVRELYSAAADRGRAAHAQWRGWVADLRDSDGGLADELERRLAGDLPEGWDADLLAAAGEMGPETGALATRQASGKAIGLIAPHLPELVGGSADLAASNNTDIADGGDVSAAALGARNLRFGIREHAMAATVNGMMAAGGMRAFGATFLIFSDYLRPALRLAALSGLESLFVFTHDSIYLGEDGPTHQPIEHLSSLRAMPNVAVLRPCDAVETLHAWKVALERRGGPTALALTRQKLATLDRSGDARVHAPRVERGGYVLRDTGDQAPQVALVATGSEVHLALEAQERLAEDGIAARVVSMPSVDLWLEQDEEWREQVLPAALRARVSIEAGATWGWREVVGDAGEMVGIDRFGLSAPADQAAEALGLTVDAVVAAANRSLGRTDG